MSTAAIFDHNPASISPDLPRSISPSHNQPRASSMNSLHAMTSDFVDRISGAVWIGKITDEAAQQALEAFAVAYQRSGWAQSGNMRDVILAEYRYCRERQDLCS
jgi:hypothetical protein